MSDVEANSGIFKEKDRAESPNVVEVKVGDGTAIKPTWSARLYLNLQKLDHFGLESRGIERVPSDERVPATLSTWAGLGLIW